MRINPSAILAVVVFVSIPTTILGGAPWRAHHHKTKSTPAAPTQADLETSPSDLATETSSTSSSSSSSTSSSTSSSSSSSTSASSSTSQPSNVETSSSPNPESTSQFNIDTSSTSRQIALESSTSTAAVEIQPTTEEPNQPAATNGPIVQSQAPYRPQQAQTLPPVDFDCKKQPDGYYADPKNKCSQIYYACVGGFGRQLKCASGLVYEPDSQSCERPNESFRCSGNKKTTIPAPTGSPQPPVKLPIDCTKNADGWYADPQQKCSHLFYSCSNGVGAQFKCPGQMYFDADSSSCQAYPNVFACSGKKPPPTTTSQTKPPVPEKVPIDCSNLDSGYYPDPAKKCSGIFYVCSNGDGFKQHCPEGLMFDPVELVCETFEDVSACSGRTKAPKNQTAVPLVPTAASLSSPEYNCNNKPDGAYLPESNKCSNFYFRCVGNFTYKLTCPASLFYDIDYDLCDGYTDVFACSGKKRAAAPNATASAPVIENVPIDCNKTLDGDFPDPQKKCSQTYYSCANAIGYRRTCPHGTYFDTNFRVCDIRENIPECSGKPRPSKASPLPTGHPQTKPSYSCEKLIDGNYPAGKCVPRYYACIGGTTVASDCPSNTYYDTELDQCGYKDEIPDCGGKRPTTYKP